MHLFTPVPAEYTSNLDLKIQNNALPMATHTRPHDLSTSTQATTNHKSTHCSRMGYTEGDTHGYLQGSYETSSGVCLFHKTQTYNICMTKHSHFPYTTTYSSTPHNTNRKHNIHHIHYTNTQHTSTLQGFRKTLFLTITATQQTFPQTPTQSLQQTKKTNMRHIHCSCPRVTTRFVITTQKDRS